jgi:hypothetical protein
MLLPALTWIPVHEAALAVWARMRGTATVLINIAVAHATLILLENLTALPPN